MTAQDVLAVGLQCRLVAHEPRRAPLLSPPVGKPTSMPTLMSKPGSVGTTAARPRGVFAVGAFGVVVAGLPGLPVDLVDATIESLYRARGSMFTCFPRCANIRPNAPQKSRGDSK